jgi:hypothetical protein
MLKGVVVVVLTLAAVLVVQGLRQANHTGPSLDFSFTDIAAEAGVANVHSKVLLDAKVSNLMPWLSSVGAAVAAADYNNDGWIDFYVTNSGRNAQNRLYRNNGNGTFTDTASAAGVADLNQEGGCMDAVWGDYDNDGWSDLYVVKWSASNRLFRNLGNGSFEDVTEKARVGYRGNGNGAMFFDYDNDGRLDIYIANYFPPQFDLWHLETTRIMHNDFETARNGGPNVLYHNNGDGTFSDVSAKLGVDDPGWSLDIGAGDINDDGWVDFYVANDFGPDKLFLNNGAGMLGDSAFIDISRVAHGLDTRKGMNVDFGDYDNDGWFDIYVTNITKPGYLEEGNMLWHNNGDGTFRDVGLQSGVADGGWGWAAKFFDANNDGWLDLVALNGFVSAGPDDYWYDLGTMATTPSYDVTDTANWPAIGNKSFSGYERTRLFVNRGNGTFQDLAEPAGITDLYDGRGVAVADIDNDGAPDLFVANQGQKACLYRNRITDNSHWLGLRLIGVRSNRDAIGARVTLRVGDQKQVRIVDGGNGFASQSDRRVLFGLKDKSRVDEIEIRWPSGHVHRLHDLTVNRYMTIREDAP